jgi:NTP pyrophosphatase (non-canonical NTP hydrolase)
MKNNKIESATIKDIYEMQAQNQMIMLSRGMYGKERLNILPIDDVQLCSYHIQQLMSEVGEVLDADKRWKNFRNEKYDKEAKAEEIADCFIVLLNIAMFSGIDSKQLDDMVCNKIKKVKERIEKDSERA